MKGFPIWATAISLVGGCASLPSYQLKVTSPHKDVVELVVYLDSRVDPDVYRAIALRELQTILRDEGKRWVPLYEVVFEFRRRGPEPERLARVIVHLSDVAYIPPAEVDEAPIGQIETILY